MRPRNTTLCVMLDRVERELRDLAVEYAYAFSLDGNLLFHATDEADSQVSFNDAELALLAGHLLWERLK